MKRVLTLLILVIMLGACSQQDNNQITSNDERDEGVIVHIEYDTSNENYVVLTLPSVENITYLDKTEDELIQLAQENNGVYYEISQEKYEELDLNIGIRIAAYFDAEFESDPPLRITDKIEVISEE
ncbi:hypothetical protein [Paucisalibacillus globulus]|uniref:hypothetical protein n=1 Tax=Paucisalibacillus globulus TaxID=351095 RepID=UPI001596431E|nr:hypothetical protein [Paucisalibacillus globulus]